MNIVADEAAYHGVETIDQFAEGELTTTVEIDDRFDAELDEIHVITSVIAVQGVDTPDEIGVSQTASIEVVVLCDGTDQVDTAFDIPERNPFWN